MLRGINKQDIFLDEHDMKKFLKELKRTKELYGYELYSYCLMPNHVHLQIKDLKNCLGKIMQSLAISYSTYFNLKYERVGHLFQNRYLSKTVETERYLLELQRYVHQNPEKAGICKTEEYRWSSYQDYIKNRGITDCEFILNKLTDNELDKIEKFIEYNKIKTESSNLLEFELLKRVSDDEALIIIKEVLEIDNIKEIQKYNKKYRDKMLKKLNGIVGISTSQISRITGIPRTIIKR